MTETAEQAPGQSPAPASTSMPNSEPESAPAAAKVAPEPLVMRAKLPLVTRFKRELIIAIAAVALLTIGAIVGLALRSHARRPPVDSEDQTVPAKPSGEVVADAPKSYAGVPQLGQPLPGDLGQPILDHQRASVGPINPPAADPELERARQAAQAARDQRAAELKSARVSALLVQTAGRDAHDSGAMPTSGETTVAPSASASRHLALDPAEDPNDQQNKADFVGARVSDTGVNPHALTPPVSPYMLSAGSVIAASLITGLRSDLPGMVTAQVTENVFDSATGRILLIPQGARLIGSYDSAVAFGQSRALVVWQRIIMPDGSSIALDNAPASDPAGYVGLADKVDSHSWSLVKGAAISTLLGVGSELQFSGGSDLVQAIRQSSQQSVSRAGAQLTSKTLSVQPSITVRPGAPVLLVVHRDLILKPWRGAR